MLLAESLLGTSSTAANYIEDVFSTYLYQGNSSTQTITNGVDLSGKGGLVWIKARNDVDDHNWYDTSRGAQYSISSNLTEEQVSRSGSLTSFNADGFSLGSNTSDNYSARTYTSWTFRKQAKFFDVVTYTGNGVAGRTVAHNLGSAPGCMIVKRTDGATNWRVYHRSLGATQYLDLDETVAAGTATTIWNDTAPTATVFSVGTNSGVNANGATYVAYLFAHDAGGFGASGADNVISCGSYTGNGSTTGPTVTLGYEPQLVITKRSSGISDWVIFDTMRGMSETSANLLYPNLSSDEGIGTAAWVVPTATGFKLANASSTVNANGSTYIYIAIRRGPMKTPTSGTSVYTTSTYTGTGTSQTVSSGLQTAGGSFIIIQDRNNGSASRVYDTSRGPLLEMYTQTTNAEVNRTSVDAGLKTFNMNGFSLGSNNYNGTNQSGYSYVAWQFRRAPGFFDVVCYTGTGVNTTVSHNLGTVPQLMIFKGRNVVTNWRVYSAAIWGTGVGGFPGFDLLSLNASSAANVNNNRLNSTQPTASVFSLGTDTDVNGSGNTYVNYLFSTVPGVSKVGSYTGTGTTKQIDCGFTNGARFVLIKRADNTGDWYVWDSARGIVSGNDPYLLLNSTAAEVTGTDYIDTYSAGFEISSTAPAAINASGGTFIFLAIA